MQFPQSKHSDEHFALDILKDGNQACDLVAISMMQGALAQIRADAAIVATGGAGCVSL